MLREDGHDDMHRVHLGPIHSTGHTLAGDGGQLPQHALYKWSKDLPLSDVDKLLHRGILGEKGRNLKRTVAMEPSRSHGAIRRTFQPTLK